MIIFDENEGRPGEHFYDSGTSERGNGGRFRVLLIEEDSSGSGQAIVSE